LRRHGAAMTERYDDWRLLAPTRRNRMPVGGDRCTWRQNMDTWM
jgi:hypothetical protein